MKRREFIKVSAAGAAAFALGARDTAAAGQEADAEKGAATAKLAPPCGLYCGICLDHVSGECHGCGCDCGKCAGTAHAKTCAIARCAARRKLTSCADCKDLPCTQLIQFCCDPIWRTHAPVVENLRRRKAIGTAAWVAEQEQFWSDATRRERWLALYRECSDRYRQAKSK